MDDDPFSGWGLRPVELADRAAIDSCFASLQEPLSDYTFTQLYTWRNSLRIFWKMIRGHLCVFANGSEDLTLLMPPIGDSRSDAALAEAFELMNDYNAGRGTPERSRVEYVSDELLARFNPTLLLTESMGADYVYDVQRMIDLAGGDLASKRQSKARFMRNYIHRIEPYSAELHRTGCQSLLDMWKSRQDHQPEAQTNLGAVKRAKESTATALCLETAEQLNLAGMVVYAQPVETVSGCLAPASIRGFTFGEKLGPNQSSITIEKTDLEAKGLAQFIFSEFCRLKWADCPLVNVGDDWGLPTLAWTKQSYRPVKLLQKYSLRLAPVTAVSTSPVEPNENPASFQRAASTYPLPAPSPVLVMRSAEKADLAGVDEMEQATFTSHALNRRQLQYHQGRESSIFLVAEEDGRLVGNGIALLRQHKNGVSGRIYSLAVRSDSRGRKIGSRLLEALLKSLASRGVSRCYLEVEQSNEAAIRLYQRCGFRRIGDLPDYYGPARAGLHLMCVLAEKGAVRR